MSIKTESNVDPRKLGAKCDECPFSKNLRPNKPVLGKGPAVPEGVLIGEGPSREDAETGRPFVGSTGRQLDLLLAEAGLVRSRLFLGNATCCHPPPQARTKPAFRKAVQACWPALVAQLATFDENTPTFAMGQWAVLSLTGKDKGVLTARGFIRQEFKLP